MWMPHTSLFFISIFLVSFYGMAQEENNMASDTIPKHSKYGLRVGVDLAKPLRTLLEDGYTGFEVVGDFRISKRFFVAAELGTEEKDLFESNLNVTTNGSYIKAGADFNAYKNWVGLNNSIYAGLRYGFATFRHDLISFGIHQTNQTFPTEIIEANREFTGLTAHWAELQIGVKTELINNLFLTLNVQLKRLISEDVPANFDNLYIPGFNRTNDFSEYGVGYGYSISYLIPIFKK